MNAVNHAGWEVQSYFGNRVWLNAFNPESETSIFKTREQAEIVMKNLEVSFKDTEFRVYESLS
jgi:hypothetical protein